MLARGAEAAMAIAEAVNLHGVLAMEAFVSNTGEIMFNEIARARITRSTGQLRVRDQPVCPACAVDCGPLATQPRVGPGRWIIC